MSTLHISEQINGRVLPQPCPLESDTADNPGVGTKRVSDTTNTMLVVASVQHDRGEIAGGTPAAGDDTNHATIAGLEQGRKAHQTIALVPVLGRDGAPLMPTHPARARKLLKSGRAVVVKAVPLVIRLKDRKINDGQTFVQDMGVGVDPGSKHTGLAVFTTNEVVDKQTGELTMARRGVFAVQVDHRSHQISEKLKSRSQLRRGRRSRNLRYRAPRFNNRPKPKGWLAPSLQHRVDGISSMVAKLRRWFPITEVHQELVRFDLQKHENPEITGVMYQRGTLYGTEVREYLLAKYKHQCVYCDAKDVPLNLDHVVPRARGGSDRVSNLVLACIKCNQRKSARLVEEFLVKDLKRLARVKAGLKRPLRDAAAVNSTRWALFQKLRATGLPVFTGSGGRTKFNRTRNRIAKSHVNDAICVGQAGIVTRTVGTVLVAKQSGRGQYQRTLPNKYGFPRTKLTRVKQHYGFATGDMVRAVVPKGKKAGTYVGRVAVRTSGSFNIKANGVTVQGIGHKYCQLLQRNDGWGYSLEDNS